MILINKKVKTAQAPISFHLEEPQLQYCQWNRAAPYRHVQRTAQVQYIEYCTAETL